MSTRRGFLIGLGALFAAPAVCHASSLMQIRGEVMLPSMTIPAWCPPGWAPANGHLVDGFQFPELHKWYQRTRQHDAINSSRFKLPHAEFKWFSGYDPIKFPDSPHTDMAEVPLIAVTPQLRPNGTVAQPGMMANFVIDAEAVRAYYPEANRIRQEAMDTLTGRITKF